MRRKLAGLAVSAAVLLNTVSLFAKGVRYVIDGKIQNLGAVNRSIVGTWVQGNQKGDFKITRH
jgi:hypothetical protein